MNIKKVSILLGLLAVLAGVAYWDEFKTSEEKESERIKNLLLSLQKESITGFELKSDVGGQSVRIERVDEEWKIVQPLLTEADQKAVNNFVKSLLEYKYHKIVAESPSQWKEFGLDQKQGDTPVTVVLNFTDGSNKSKTIEVYTGIDAPLGYSIYSRTTESDEVYVGSQYLRTLLGKSLNEFRNRSILHIDEKKLTALTYHMRLQAPISLKKVPGGYEILGDKPLKADKMEVAALIRDLNGVNAQSFADAPVDEGLQKSLAKENAAYQISWTESDESYEIYFGRFQGSIWATSNRQKIAYKLPDTFEPKIRKLAGGFRDRTIFNFDSTDVSRVEIDGSQYKKVNNEWILAQVNPESEVALNQAQGADSSDYDWVRSLVVDLEYAKTSKFIEPFSAEYRSFLEAAPVHEILLSIKGKQGESELTIKAWESKEETKYLIQILETKALYLMGKELIDGNLSVRDASRASVLPLDAVPPESQQKDQG